VGPAVVELDLKVDVAASDLFVILDRKKVDTSCRIKIIRLQRVSPVAWSPVASWFRVQVN
jgi:hypothetical protein